MNLNSVAHRLPGGIQVEGMKRRPMQAFEDGAEDLVDELAVLQ